MGPEVVDFLVGRGDVLEEVVLRECYACAPTAFQGFAENGMTWAEIFDGIVEAKPDCLVRFELESKVPLTSREEYGKDGSEGEEEEDEDGEDVRSLRRMLEECPGKKLFPHATLDEKYGMLFRDEQENTASALGGEDQEAWDRLMGVEEGNRRRKEGGGRRDLAIGQRGGQASWLSRRPKKAKGRRMLMGCFNELVGWT